MKEEFVFYFGPASVYAHWFKCNFFIHEQHFCCVEQYIMYQKAIMFHDFDIANKILKSSVPARHRYLGKQVNGFNRALWQQECKQFAFDGNVAKFEQNKLLEKQLLGSIGKTLAEASPYDRNWGIGLSIQNPKIYDRLQWWGKNWAGEVLESVRKKLPDR